MEGKGIGKNKYLIKLNFPDKTLYCKTGSKGEVFEGSWGASFEGDKFQQIKIWRVKKRLGWNGYYKQGNIVKEMQFAKFELISNTIEGNGDD